MDSLEIDSIRSVLSRNVWVGYDISKFFREILDFFEPRDSFINHVVVRDIVSLLAITWMLKLHSLYVASCHDAVNHCCG